MSSGSSAGTVNYWAHTITTTDGFGRFSLRGEGENQTRVIVVTADGQMVQPALASGPGQNLKIILPKPATVIVHYDIPGDQPQADFNLTLRTNELEMPLWKYVTLTATARVSNGGQTVLTNLTPGSYDLSRLRMGGPIKGGYSYMFIYGDPAGQVQTDHRRLVLEPGRTQEVSFERSVGQRVQGQVMGMENVSNLVGAFLYVGSATAISSPNDFRTNNLEPCYDAVKLDTNGVFQTAILEPGHYTFLTEAFQWGKPSKPKPIPDDEPQYGGFGGYYMNSRPLSYVGSAQVTVTTNGAPSVKIELRPWGEPADPD
jgi:hypothetical protein